MKRALFSVSSFFLLAATVFICSRACILSRTHDHIFTASTGGMSADSTAGRGMAVFAQKVSEYTNGSMTIQVYYGTELGGSTSLIFDMMDGKVDFGVCGDSYYATLVPEIQAYELPYLFNSLEQARAALEGPSFRYIQKQLESSGLKALSFWEIGFRQLTSSSKSIQGLQDLNNFKLRCLPAVFQIMAWEYAGCKPFPLDISELYSALKEERVDGQDNPLSEIYSQRLYEVQRYLSITNHVYTPMLFSCSQEVWNLLTESEQNAVIQAAADARNTIFAMNDAETDSLITKLKDRGMQIIRDINIEPIRQEMTRVHTVFGEMYGTKFLELLRYKQNEDKM